MFYGHVDRLCKSCKGLIDGKYYENIITGECICDECSEEHAGNAASQQNRLKFLLDKLQDLDNEDLAEIIDTYCTAQEFAQWFYSGEYLKSDTQEDN